MVMKARLVGLLLVVGFLLLGSESQANPYLARPGEKPVALRIATCAVSGGFTHLYTALDYKLFDKYGIRLEHIYIRGSGPSLAALALYIA
jgi:hypothetical protein